MKAFLGLQLGGKSALFGLAMTVGGHARLMFAIATDATRQVEIRLVSVASMASA
jgi:hypothetical protein